MEEERRRKQLRKVLAIQKSNGVFPNTDGLLTRSRVVWWVKHRSITDDSEEASSSSAMLSSLEKIANDSNQDGTLSADELRKGVIDILKSRRGEDSMSSALLELLGMSEAALDLIPQILGNRDLSLSELQSIGQNQPINVGI